MDLADLRARQHECLELIAPKTLRSVTAILSAAEGFAKTDRGPELLAWLSRWIRDLVLVHVEGDREHLLHFDSLAQLENSAQQADLGMLLDLLREIERIEQGATRHLNLHMALETILLRLREALGLAPVETPA